ncbi:TonB-dependent receptor [Olivibacter sp. SDN3]|uniref:TonB-dependent receptor n=1 Tax=Olivibacter sp. SDN3 TaxID=2764720 RepID=UPI001C9E8DA2|nr:TonB-dependent receptor [Olivibacter sp. SDN3]
MKLCLSILLLSFIHVSGSNLLAQHVSIQEKKISIKAVLKQLKAQANIEFLYMADELDDQQKVSINLKNKPLQEVLDACFNDQPVNYTIDGAVVLISRKNTKTITQSPSQQEKTVTGTVHDAYGNPLSGASVTLKNTPSTSTSVQSDGKFSIRVPANGVLMVSYLGFITQEVPIEGKENLQIILDEENAELEEVVVVGYGTVTRKDLTGSVSSVSANQIQDLAVPRLDQALLGKIPGVQVMPVSGAPGAEPQIRVRGVGSISAGSTPLYVVDGFPIDNIQTLNPNDIESMDILKDASATAIYGSRGANGVIIVNTKRGKTGKPVLGFDAYYGLQSISKSPSFMNVQQQAQYYYDGIRNRNIDVNNAISGDPAQWGFTVPQTVLDVLNGTNTTNIDALDYVLQTAPQQQYQLSANGGSENVKYAVSGEFLDQEGIIINSDFRRYSFRSNLDAKLSDKLNIQLNLNGAFTDENRVTESGWGGGANQSIVSQATSAQYYYPVLNNDGSYFIYRDLDASTNLFNPLALATDIKNSVQMARFLGNINASYAFSDSWKLNLMAGATYNSLKDMRFVPQLPAFLNSPPNGTDNTAMTLNWITETTLNYSKTFGDHSLTALVGFSSQQETIKDNFLESNNFPNNLVPYLSAVSGIFTDGSANRNDWSLVSYLSRFNYNYKSKYYLTASVRTDGSSRFGSDSKYGFFPSAAFAWRLSEEGFLRNVEVLNDLKMRLSYGQTGNNNIGNYEHFATVMYYRYNLGGSPVGGYAPDRLANPNLTWEKQRSLNLGVDATLLKNRISVTFDYFNSRNTDLLLNVNVPAITGFNTTLQNIGEVENTGFEFVLNTQNIKTAFTWSTDLNLSTYRNKVLRLGPTGDPIISARHITMIGQPIGMFYGLQTDGVFLNQQELDAGPIYNPGAPDRSRVGDQRFLDVSGPNGVPDGVINSYDYTIIGSPYPDFYYGMTNRFSYKNWNLSISLQGAYGNQITSTANDIRLTTRSRSKTLDTQLNYWRSEADPGDGLTPRPNDAPTGGVRTVSDRYLDSGSYLRINNITLGYMLPSAMVESMKMSSFRIYLSANNPFLFTKNTSFNPDVSTGIDALTPGIDYNNYPLPKSFILGINARF